MRPVRFDGRKENEIRPVQIAPGYQKYAEGSALIELGETMVLSSVSVEDRVPAFLRGQNSGWITAEYGMLPRATHIRMKRESSSGGIKGRTHEIQRLIGRSLRAAVNLDLLGERTFNIDCDVIQADGGTRTAAITSAYVALYQAFQTLRNKGEQLTNPFKNAVAATSVGIIGGAILLDLNYEEDSHAEVDFNIVMNDAGEFIEVQGTAEGNTFSRDDINSVLTLAEKGICELFGSQQAALQEIGS